MSLTLSSASFTLAVTAPTLDRISVRLFLILASFDLICAGRDSPEAFMLFEKFESQCSPTKCEIRFLVFSVSHPLLTLTRAVRAPRLDRILEYF